MSTFKVKQGTILKWKSSGGDAVLTLTSVASAGGRQGGSLDLGATFAELYTAYLKLKFGSAPTAGLRVRPLFGFSPDNSLWPGGLTGADGAFTDTDLLKQLVECRSMPVDNSTSSQIFTFPVRPLARYVAPVIWNEAGQTLSGTATDHELWLVPIEGDGA